MHTLHPKATRFFLYPY